MMKILFKLLLFCFLVSNTTRAALEMKLAEETVTELLNTNDHIVVTITNGNRAEIRLISVNTFFRTLGTNYSSIKDADTNQFVFVNGKIVFKANALTTNLTHYGTLTANGDLVVTGAMRVIVFYASNLVLSNALFVSSGGTGRTNLATGSILMGNGTNPVAYLTIGTGLSTNGNSLSVIASANTISNVTISSAQYAFDLSAANSYYAIIQTNTTITLSNIQSGIQGSILFRQASNGVHIITLATNNIFTNALVKFTTNGNAADLLSFTTISSNAFLVLHTNFSPYVATSEIISNATGWATLFRAFYTFNELSDGTAAVSRADSFSTNTLTDINTVASDSSSSFMSTICASFTNSLNEYFTAVDNDEISNWTNGLLLSFWAQFNSTNGDRCIFRKGASMATSGGYGLYHRSSTSKLRFWTSSGASVSYVDASLITDTGVVYYVCAWAATNDNKLYITINNASTNSATWSGTITNDASILMISSQSGYGMDGRIDALGIGHRTPTAAEISLLYNGGVVFEPSF